ncbi:Hypothetical predicted protein [Octopus vulgaris]|uniref:Small integral membrane protein 12-A n=2 Tax=Octopus vulgaris TaxID=6645 RepID=A0AA36B3F4_OCTVU|nr:Hypothetical predicted protein [Octopus vulgaris]
MKLLFEVKAWSCLTLALDTAVRKSLCQTTGAGMWPLIIHFARTYAVYITWPIAATVGFIGYNLESKFGKNTSAVGRSVTIQESRNERNLEEITSSDSTNVASLKSKVDFPKTILGRNDPH